MDPEAAKNGPFGGPIAHGYLTLALAPVFLGEVLQVDGISMGVNYGCNKVRFPAPVMVGSNLRARRGGGRGRGRDRRCPGRSWTSPSRCEGVAKPSCVAQVVYRYYA